MSFSPRYFIDHIQEDGKIINDTLPESEQEADLIIEKHEDEDTIVEAGIIYEDQISVLG